MSNEKLIEKIFHLLDRGQKKFKSERIAELLKKMKQQERATRKKLLKVKDRSKKKRLFTKVKILHTQRKKALHKYKELKKKC